MNKKFIIQLKIIINSNLYKKNVIDENTYIKANDILLNELSKGETNNELFGNI